MKNKHSTLMVITICSGLLLGCSSNNNAPFIPPSTAIGAPTGIPDEDSFTLSRDKNVIEGLRYTDVQNVIHVYVADRHNYAVPDGTVINLLTDAGALVTRACKTVNGACDVTWRSQNPNPPDGIVSVIAYTMGEESFVDTNGNDQYDLGEVTTDVTEPYIDSNKNGAYDAGLETFVDENGNNIWDGGDGVYTGTQCVGDVTVCNRTQLYVWTHVTFGDSDSFADFTQSGYTASSDTTAAAGSTAFIQFALVDKNGIGLPDGTTVAVTASGGTLTTSSFTSNGSPFYSTTFTAPTTAGTVLITVTATTPLGNVSTITLTFVVT